MRTTPLALAVFLACAGAAGARSDAPADAGKASARGIYLIDFVEPPLASFQGMDAAAQPKLAGLKATSPVVTGTRRLDVEAPASRAYRAALSDWREGRLAALSAQFGRELRPLFVYEVTSNGVALELSAAEAAQVGKSEGVARVEPDFTRRPMTDAGPQWIHADSIWNGAAGIATRGEGVVVGVIDSGINRTHPSFQATGPVDGFRHVNPKPGFFGRCASGSFASECNTKLIGIHDFTLCTGTHANSECNDREANDGLDGTGHGTHVASTAAGNAVAASIAVPNGTVSRPISGVAPHANLISYKACESEETCRGSWLRAAIDQAVADGVDVINYSIGGAPRNLWTSGDAVAMLAAREAGVVVVVAAGNDGPEAATVTSPGDAPWVLTAANATHDRGIVNRLVDLSGGDSAPPSGGVLVGVGSTAGYGPRVLVRDAQFPGCSIGTDLDSPPTGVSNPWQPGRFNGEIVVCDRGVQARVAKSNNVRLAGGGGMVLVNQAGDGESVVADAHSIPGTHLGYTAGQALKAWMATGSGHSARIEGTRVESIPELGDILASSSGRGPIESVPGLLKPDLTAPGTSIMAAARTGTGTAFMSGTSMATPHLSGASALLIAAKPNWNPSEVESALLTTARPSVRHQNGVRLATPFEQGSGVADLARASRAGLAFVTSPSEFRNANPAQGGVPRDLNRPSLVHEDCFERCVLSRRISDLAGGASWRVEFDLPSPASATATPSSFTLAPGASQDVTFNFDISDASFPGAWVNGRVKFIRTGGAAAENAEIPLTLFAQPGALPAKISVTGTGESGYQDVAFSGLVSLPEAGVLATALVAPSVDMPSLVQDPTRDDRYDDFAIGSFVRVLRVPARAGTTEALYRVDASTRSATAYDVDLFVGEDLDGDGAPDESEELCTSAGARADERCQLDVTAGNAERRYWVLVQNWDAGAQGSSDPAGTSDTVVLETAVIPTTGTGETLKASGPGRTQSREPFALRVVWNDPTLLPGERRLGVIRLQATPQAPDGLGVIPVEVLRSLPGEAAPAALAVGSRHMRLAPGAAQDKLYFDVPPNAASLTVSSSGSGEVDLYLAKADNASSPVIASAPARGLAQGTSIHPGATESITLTGGALSPGRWYVTPVNTGIMAAEFDLKVELSTATARAPIKFGPYYNPARSGSGLILLPAGPVWSLAWYTYLQDGTPTWYLGAAAAPGPQDGVWRVRMDRYRWDGDSARATSVGEVQLAFTDATHFAFSWNLDGESGSEPMTWLDGGGCPNLNSMPAALSGVWYAPSRSGFGYAINAYSGIESNGAYFYDGQGIARWALGSAAPFGVDSMRLTQREGFCPLCPYREPVARDIGSLTRRYDSAGSGQIRVDLTLLPPLAGSWSVDLPATRLTDALTCP